MDVKRAKMSDLKRLVESVSPKLDLHFGMPIHEPNPVSFWCPVIQKKILQI